MTKSTSDKVVDNAISAIYGSSNKDTGSRCQVPPKKSADRKTLTEQDEIAGACFACYLENTLQNTIGVLHRAGQTLATAGNKNAVEEGIAIATTALAELFEELKSRSHGQGLPKNMVPVRGIPYVVNSKKKK
jgi:hypothetical protein